MLGQKDNNNDCLSSAVPGGVPRKNKNYLRSVSWSDRSPSKPIPRPHQPNSKARSCLPPLQPLSIAHRPIEEWPTAGSDDLGVWPNPQTPRGPAKPLENSNLEQQPVREFMFKKDKLAFFDKECSRIADHIYLGSDAVAKNREVLRQNGITHVLNCVGFVCPEYFKNDLVYKTLWLQDSPSEDITSILYDVFDYFEDVREQGGRVLVHCCQGVSRSTSLVIAYLMWREGQSFEDAFQYVKAARGVTNPNMGFACQLLQCQKRVHAVPASPNSVLRVYRMAPHSSYDPLHLVPKMLGQPDVRGLDSRGAFIVHVPTTIFVWFGKKCNSVMLNQAKVAANQVIRYESAQGPVMIIKEGEEPSEFWDALAVPQIPADDCQRIDLRKEEVLSSGNDSSVVRSVVHEKKVDDYDLDFGIFLKALAGGVVPPFSVANTETETCLPARESGWGRLRQKFAAGMMKEFLTSSRLKHDHLPSTGRSEMITDTCREPEQIHSSVDSPSTSSQAAFPCGSPDSFDCFLNSSPSRIVDSSGAEHSVSIDDPLLPPPTPSGSSDSFSCFLENSPKFGYKSPTLSPSTSDYSSSSFAFSPSSSNWSDLSYLSSRQPSPSGLEAVDPLYAKTSPLADKFYLPYKETPSSPTKVFPDNHALRSDTVCLSLKGSSPSLAERRGSNPPPRMLLTSVEETSQVPRNLVRSWSFSLPDLDDDVMKDQDELSDDENRRDEQMTDADSSSPGDGSQSEIEESKKYGSSPVSLSEITAPILYQWPKMVKLDIHSFGMLDSGSVYIMFAPDLTLHSNNPAIAYVWLGRDFSCEEAQSEVICSPVTHGDSCRYWEAILHNFLNQNNCPANIPMQIIRQGEEPEQFLNFLSGFSFQDMNSQQNRGGL
ncbi:protein-tyrosine-phosphatase MKP1-like [Euphorbia lathyris]|uniref:protein-tyrosine-phosphatase MKP1-like n=1 Tax=Euphorbia lathyris TaxID=212925 RepID=UPI0033143B1C